MNIHFLRLKIIIVFAAFVFPKTISTEIRPNKQPTDIYKSVQINPEPSVYESSIQNGMHLSESLFCSFFGFGQTKKKTSTSSAPNQQLLQQQPSQGATVTCGALSKRRGSDRSLSGSAHELAVSGVKDSKVPHSHSQSNLSDIPYR